MATQTLLDSPAALARRRQGEMEEAWRAWKLARGTPAEPSELFTYKERAADWFSLASGQVVLVGDRAVLDTFELPPSRMNLLLSDCRHMVDHKEEVMEASSFADELEARAQHRLVWLLFGGGAMALLLVRRVPHTHALMDIMQQVQLRAAGTLATSVLAAFALQPMAAAGLVIFMVLLAVLVVRAGDLRDIKAANRGDTSALQRRIAKLYSVRSELLMMAARQPAMLQGLQALADRAFTTRTRLSVLL